MKVLSLRVRFVRRNLAANIIVSLVLFVIVQCMLSHAQTGLVFQKETHAGVGALSDVGLLMFNGKRPLSECFYRAMLCIRGISHGPVSVRLCLSQVGVLLQRLNIGSHKQHHTIVQGL